MQMLGNFMNSDRPQSQSSKAIAGKIRYGYSTSDRRVEPLRPPEVEQAESVMEQIMTGGATEAQIGAYLMALRMKGEIDRRDHRQRHRHAQSGRQSAHQRRFGPARYRCGTGGDKSGTFNISTTSAFVAAGAGIPVAKHGNRAATSKCGSADVLAELGLNLDLSPEQVGRCIDEIGIGFMFAVKMHPAMRHAIGRGANWASAPSSTSSVR